ncbi:IS66-like element accessory protein TnpA [Rubrimonas cliftonensis]|nr:transposase [Rubrimonas cliftonensis]
MGAHTDSCVSRLEVVEVGRRRRWSDAEKLRIVAESMAGRRQVSATARRHGISRSQLVTWRDLAREGRLIDGSDAAPCDAPTFTPVVLAADPPATSGADARIEIVLCNGRRLLVGADVDAVAVARLVDALDRR